jgi:hypothetical protein
MLGALSNAITCCTDQGFRSKPRLGSRRCGSARQRVFNLPKPLALALMCLASLTGEGTGKMHELI